MVNVEGKEFDIELEYRSEKYFAKIDGKEIEIDSFPLGVSRSILIIEGKALEIDVRSNGYDNRKTVFMKGQEIPVDIENYQLAQLRKTAGMSTAGAVQKVIKAPMPGLILDVKVSPGDSIAKGQPVMIIEAMKMENIIKAAADGVIKEVPVKSGASVEKGDALLEME
jgi:biotin carboxyl carrier protein